MLLNRNEMGVRRLGSIESRKKIFWICERTARVGAPALGQRWPAWRREPAGARVGVVGAG